MAVKNSELPESLQEHISSMRDFEALALGVNEGVPFFALKLPDDFTAYLEGELSCEFKPAMLNITYHEQTFGLCIVQFRLNGNDRFICSMHFDLSQSKEYEIARALLQMQEYNLLLVTKELHRAMEFKANFVGTFSPVVVLEETLERLDCSDRSLCRDIYRGIASQFDSPSAMWYSFESIAPSHHRWYAKM